MAKFILCLSIGLWLNWGAMAQPKPANGRTNENYVWLFKSNQKLERFFPLRKPAFENKNGKLNISVANDSNELFQINGIPETWLKDTTIANSKVQLVLMKSTATYSTSSKKPNTRIQLFCPNKTPGQPIRIVVKSTIYNQERSYKVEAQLIGVVPAKQSVILNK